MQTHALLYKCPSCGTPQEIEPQHEGEVITCINPACGKPFQLELPIAHPMMPPDEAHGLLTSEPEAAPQEQRQLILPEGMTPSVAAPQAHGQDHAQANGAPVAAVPVAAVPLNTDILPDASEKTVLTARPAMFRRFPGRFLGYLALILAGGYLTVYSHLQSPNLWFFEVVGAGLFLYGAYYLISWWVRIHATTVTVTNHRTIVVQGLFNKETVEIAHQDVDHLEVHQNWFQRLMGVGDLDVVTAKGKKNVSVMALPNPQGVANQIRAQHPSVRHAAGDSSVGQVAPPPPTAGAVQQPGA